MAQRKFGWYSKKQAELFGCFVYKDILGFEVIVTQSTDSDKNHMTGFDDMVMVGEVFEFVREIKGIISKIPAKESISIDYEKKIIPFDFASLFVKDLKGPK